MNPADVCSGPRTKARKLTRGEWEWIQQIRRAAVCARKKSYETRSEAVYVAVSRVNSFRDAPPHLTAYLCDTCGKWHLTKSKISTPTKNQQ